MVFVVKKLIRQIENCETSGGNLANLTSVSDSAMQITPDHEFTNKCNS